MSRSLHPGVWLLWPLLTSAPSPDRFTLRSSMIVCHGLLSLSCIPKGSCRPIAQRHAWACSTSGPSGISAMSASSHVKQISPDKDVNFHCTTAAFTVSAEPRASLCCANLPTDSAFLCCFCSSAHSFAVCFLQTLPNGFALALGYYFC